MKRLYGAILRFIASVGHPSAHGSRFRQNFIRVAGANIFGQVLPIAVAPLMTRLYAPADYGSMALFTAVMTILVSAAVLRLDWLASSAKTQKRSVNFLLLGGATLSVVAISVSIIFFGDFHLRVGGDEWTPIKTIVLWLPIAVFLTGLNVLLTGWFVRDANLAPVASTRIVSSICSTAVGLVLGLMSFGVYGLLASLLSGALISTVVLLRSAKTMRRQLRSHLLPRIILTARLNLGRIGYSGTTGIVNTIGLFIPIILITHNFSVTEAGWYALMQRLATAPIATLTGAIAQSFWGEANALMVSSPPALLQLFKKTTKTLCLMSIPVGVLCGAGPFFVGPVFGVDHWGKAGWVLAALGPFIVSQIIASPLSPIITVLRRERWIFFWDLARTSLIGLVFLAGYYAGLNFFYTIAIYSAVAAAMYIVLFRKMYSMVTEFAYSGRK